METSRSVHKSLSVLAVSGTVDRSGDGLHLRAQLLAAVAEAEAPDGGDVALDARGLVSFDDSALSALTTARSRARHLGHRLVVVDGVDGRVTTALRRSGLLYRFPVYDDVAAAERGLAADRAAADRRVLHPDRDGEAGGPQ